MKARYNRISTANQNLERQLAKQNPDEVLYNDVISGSVAFAERPKGKELIELIEAGNINYIVVSSIDRLGRNLFDVIKTLEYFNSMNVTLRVDNLDLNSLIDGKINPIFNLIISVMANLAQMEKATLLERQKEGIAIARAKGTYKGRLKGTTETDSEVLAKHKEVVKYIKQNHSIRNIMKLTGKSSGIVQKVKKIVLNDLSSKSVA